MIALSITWSHFVLHLHSALHASIVSIGILHLTLALHYMLTEPHGICFSGKRSGACLCLSPRDEVCCGNLLYSGGVLHVLRDATVTVPLTYIFLLQDETTAIGRPL